MDNLENLRKVYNSTHVDKIPRNADIWKTLKRRLHRECDDGRKECVLEHLIKKPIAPKSWIRNPTEWLSSTDIEKVEHEFARVFRDYYFVGCIPIDFDKKSELGTCIVSSLCSLRIHDLYKRGYRKIGIVFNTDVSTGPGQHWFALFADIDSKYQFSKITYFDSYSSLPEKEVVVLMNRWKNQIDEMHINELPTCLTFNKVRHQYKDTECGMYSLYFHYCCLNNIPLNKRIPDDVINSFRKVLFDI